MLYHVTVGDRTLSVELGSEEVTVDGRPVQADLRRVPGTRVHSLLLDGASHRVVARQDGNGTWNLHLRGRRMRAGVIDERTRIIREMTGAGTAASGPAALRAPMPGLVVKVEVEEGDAVEPGQGLVIVEAMKMENELRAAAAGRVARVLVEPGEAVDKDQVLIELESTDGSGGGD
ncbi:MAG: biotin/lipoyl-binding protein [Gemmatimonadota bacterium]